MIYRLRPSAALLACLAFVVVVGCGGSSRKPLTKAQATVLAGEVNLKAADLPGFTGAPERTSSSDRRLAAQLASCAGGVDPSKAVADVESEGFSHGSGLQSQQVSSDVTVMPSSALAKQDLTAIKSSRGQGCIVSFVNRLLAGLSSGRVKLGGVTLSPLPPSSPGADGSFGYRFTATATAGEARIPFYVDIQGFVLGPTQVQLLVLSVGQPFSAAEEQRLYTLLVTRAKAHPA